MEPPLYLALILILVSAVFTTAEVAYSSLPPSQKKYLERKKGQNATTARAILAKPGLPLMSVSLLCTVSNSAALILIATSPSLIPSPGLSMLIGAPAILLIGKSIPRQIARRNPLPVVRTMAFPIMVLSKLLFPITWPLHSLSKAFARTVVVAPDEHEFPDTPLSMEDKSEEEQLAATEDDALRILHFNKMQVRTIMTHRTDMFVLNATDILQDIFPALIDTGFSRVPVYQDEKENIIGILHMNSVLKAFHQGRQKEPVAAFIEDALFVPQNKHVDDVYFLLKEKQSQMAVILDEYGGVSGLITLEDIAGQLFGELYDEHEQLAQERIRETEQGSGLWLATGDTPFQQLVDELDIPWKYPEKVGTLAAYLMTLTGSIPTEGEKIESPIGVFTVLSMKGRRIEDLSFLPVQDDED